MPRIQIHLYVETLQPDGRWEAATSGTFVEQELPISGHLVHSMEPASCPENFKLYGLLSDEAWESTPWSCWQKGLPNNASPQVQALSQDWEGEAYGHNYLTLQELSEKYVELLEDPRPQARELQEPLGKMIYILSSDTQRPAEPENQRIVFWFH